MSVGGKELVLETLRRAASQDAAILKPAEQQLQQWEAEPGFYSTLVQIFSERSLEVTVRWLAVLYFKNGVDRYWRKTAPNAINEEEKVNIRQGLLQNLSEPVPQIATQLAVLIAKIARVDCPKEWGELLPALFEAVRSTDQLVQHRTLLTLHHVVKQLASKRLAADRRTFQELTSQMYNYLYELWKEHTQAFLAQGPNHSAIPSLERSHLTLKILRKLTIHGFKRPDESRDPIIFMEGIFERVKHMLEFRKNSKIAQGSDELQNIAEKNIILLLKVLRDFLEDFPFSFLSFIKPSLELATFYLFMNADKDLLFERLNVQLMNLLKSILLSPEYKPCKVIEETKNPQTLQAHRIKIEFFTPTILAGICQKLVTDYFPLTPDDLENWDCDPEGYCAEIEGGEGWKYSLRPCTEALLVALFHEYRTTLTPVLVELIKWSDATRCHDISAIVERDAVYTAAGLAAFELFDDIDFDQWFNSSLIQELNIKDPNYRVIRRRVIWLIGQWSGVKFSPENRPTLYQAIIHLLAPEEDMVVRLTTAATLRLSLDDFEFDPEQFMPFLPTIFGLLFGLLKEAKECDTKMQVLHVMSFMIEVVGTAIRPHAAPLTQYLPGLWDASADHNLLRCAILTTLVHMVTGLMRESENLHEFLITIIRISTDVREPCHVYLSEDGLMLWLSTLENTSRAHTSLLTLYDNMLPLMQVSMDNLRLCLQITTAYTLLCPNEFLTKYGEPLVEALKSLLTDAKNDDVVLVLRAVEMLLRVLPGPGGDLLRPLLPSIMVKVAQADCYPLLMSMYLSLLARLILYTEDLFTWVLKQASSVENQSPEELLERLVWVWSDKLPLVSPEERRKLCALGLARLCGLAWSPVIKIWPQAVTSIVEVVYDVTLEDSTQDKLVVSSGGSIGTPEPLELETEHVCRRQRLAERDPVHTTSLREFLGSQMHLMSQRVDSETITRMAQDLDHNCRLLLQEITPS